MKVEHILTFIFILAVLYLFYLIIQYRNLEHFENALKTENSCRPPQSNTEYSYRINTDFCVGNITCPRKGDICVNQHCVPPNQPVPNSILEDCVGCPKPGLI
jgi:hypothetical protein